MRLPAVIPLPHRPTSLLPCVAAVSVWLALPATPSLAGTPHASVSAFLRSDLAVTPEASTSGPIPAAAATAALPPGDCLERLDAAVVRANDGDTAGAEARLRWLAGRCEHLPQIRHDLGVLAARAGRLPDAIAALEASIAEDPRAAMTLDHLRALHRREAALAYARALGRPLAGHDAATLPELVLQDSGDVNAEALRTRAGHGDLHTLATVEYELYDWWHSAAGADTGGWLAHYVEGYPEALALAGRARDAGLPWSEVRREIAFTAEDAVAVLEHGDGARTERRLLLLRLQGNRWKIYQETPL